MKRISYERHRFSPEASAQRFLVAHDAVYTQRHLTSRRTLRTFRCAAQDAWKVAVKAARMSWVLAGVVGDVLVGGDVGVGHDL